jgi:hypothetical protein
MPRQPAFSKPEGYILLVNDDNIVELLRVHHVRTTPSGFVSHYKAVDGRVFTTQMFHIESNPKEHLWRLATSLAFHGNYLMWAGHIPRRIDNEAREWIIRQLLTIWERTPW